MGHSRDERGRLICDGCDEAGGVRTRRCPHGWCSADLCARCVKVDARWVGPGAHDGCRASSARFRLEDARKAEAIAAGEAVRCAALAVDLPTGERAVHVIFKTQAGDVGAYMPHRTYDAFPLLACVTLRQYQEHAGRELEAAPVDFQVKP